MEAWDPTWEAFEPGCEQIWWGWEPERAPAEELLKRSSVYGRVRTGPYSQTYKTVPSKHLRRRHPQQSA